MVVFDQEGDIVMKIQKPITVIRYSLVPVFLRKGRNRIRFFASFLIFPAIVTIPWMLWDIIKLQHKYIEVYDAYVIKRSGVFRKYEEKHMFPKIESCTVVCRFWQRVFKYGTIEIKTYGNRFNLGDDENLRDIKNPFLIRKHLERHFVTAKEIKEMRQTFIST